MTERPKCCQCDSVANFQFIRRCFASATLGIGTENQQHRIPATFPRPHFILTRKKKDFGFSPFVTFGETVNLIINSAPRANIKTGTFLRLFSTIYNLHAHIIAKLAAKPLHCFHPIATERRSAFYLTKQCILPTLQDNINFITVGIAIIVKALPTAPICNAFEKLIDNHRLKNRTA